MPNALELTLERSGIAIRSASEDLDSSEGPQMGMARDIAEAYRINSTALTAAAPGFGDKEAVPKTKPVHLPLDVLPAQARHPQKNLVLGTQVLSQLLVI
jgi:hypothetical protein